MLIITKILGLMEGDGRALGLLIKFQKCVEKSVDILRLGPLVKRETLAKESFGKNFCSL